MQAIKELFKQLVGIWKELGLNQKITVSATTLAVISSVIPFYLERAHGVFATLR